MTTSKRNWIKHLLCAALAVSTAGAWAQAKPPVRIAAINPLSGAGAFDGQLALEGMQAMVAIINANGGVLGGRQLQLVTYDDKGSPEEGVSAAKRAIEQDKVDLIVGGWFSAVALGQKEVTRDKIVHVVTSAQHPKVTDEGHNLLLGDVGHVFVLPFRFGRPLAGWRRLSIQSFMGLPDQAAACSFAFRMASSA